MSNAAWNLLAQERGEFGPVEGLALIIYLGLLLLLIAGMWKVFTKAGKPGWASIIPIYNFIVLVEIVGRPFWWIVMMFIPCVNVIFAIILSLDLAKAFGKGPGFGIGLAFIPVIFYPILGFGDAQYEGPVAES